jgi:hypothetical protein
MADLRDLNFTPEDIPKRGAMEPLPVGTYLVTVQNSEERVSNAGNKYLNVEFQVIEGDHSGRLLWTNFNLWNKNETAAQIALSEFANLCIAVGKGRSQVNDSAELHGSICRVKVIVEKRRDTGDPANRIKGFSPVNIQGTPNPYSEEVRPAQPSPAQKLEEQTPW